MPVENTERLALLLVPVSCVTQQRARLANHGTACRKEFPLESIYVADG